MEVAKGFGIRIQILLFYQPDICIYTINLMFLSFHKMGL